MEESYVMTLEDNKKRFQEMYLCFCGYSFCEPDHMFGPAVRPNYILHYILKGSGQYRIGNRTYALGAQKGFLIEPNVMTTYRADHDNPWMYLWIGFSGTAVSKLLDDIGLSHGTPIFTATCGDQLLEIVKSMLQCSVHGVEKDLFLQAQLYRFLACLAHNLSGSRNEFRQEQQNYYVHAAVEFIQTNYADNIRVRDMADYVGVSRSYLTTLFQEIMQVSPNEYLTKFRLTRAREQLTITDLPVSTIAGMCGYRDALVFSKAFKQHADMTPTQYRRTNREEQRMSILQMRGKDKGK